MRIAALSCQVLLGLVEFILIERKLGVCKVQQVGILRIRLFGQLRDAALIPGDLGLQLIHALHQIPQWPRLGWTIGSGLARRYDAGQFVIGGRKASRKLRFAGRLFQPVPPSDWQSPEAVY
jgi:hypothetical protein